MEPAEQILLGELLAVQGAHALVLPSRSGEAKGGSAESAMGR